MGLLGSSQFAWVIKSACQSYRNSCHSCQSTFGLNVQLFGCPKVFGPLVLGQTLWSILSSTSRIREWSTFVIMTILLPVSCSALSTIKFRDCDTTSATEQSLAWTEELFREWMDCRGIQMTTPALLKLNHQNVTLHSKKSHKLDRQRMKRNLNGIKN